MENVEFKLCDCGTDAEFIHGFLFIHGVRLRKLPIFSISVANLLLFNDAKRMKILTREQIDDLISQMKSAGIPDFTLSLIETSARKSSGDNLGVLIALEFNLLLRKISIDTISIF